MITDIDVDGVFVPSALLAAIIALLVQLVVKTLMGWFGVDRVVGRMVWHRGLFEFATFMILWGVFTLSMLHPVDGVFGK